MSACGGCCPWSGRTTSAASQSACGSAPTTSAATTGAWCSARWRPARVRARRSGYGRWSNPVGGLTPRTTTSLAGWLTEGRAGAAIRADRSLRQHLGFGADLHVGFDAMWMATTDLGYLDRRLWDDAGTIEAGPWVATTARRGADVLRA